MRKISTKWTFASILACLLLTVFIKDCDNFKYKFRDYDELLNSNLIDGGWIPDILPKSSVNINVTTNIDTNEVYLDFNAKQDGIDYIIEKTEKIDMPDEFKKLLKPEEFNTYIYSKNNDSSFFFIKNEMKNQLYFVKFFSKGS